MRLESVSEGIYTWSFHDRIAIPSEKTHEVTRCKQTHTVQLNTLNLTGVQLSPPSPSAPDGPLFQGKALSWRKCGNPGTGFQLHPDPASAHGYQSAAPQTLETQRTRERVNLCVVQTAEWKLRSPDSPQKGSKKKKKKVVENVNFNQNFSL